MGLRSGRALRNVFRRCMLRYGTMHSKQAKDDGGAEMPRFGSNFFFNPVTQTLGIFLLYVA